MTTATTTLAHRRHDISGRAGETIAPHLSGGSGKVGRPAEDDRRLINAVFWILRTGAPWRGMPPDCGHWNTTAHRFGRWPKSAQWTKLRVAVSDDPDLNG